MSDAWVPFPVSGWPETAEALTALGRPWPRGAAIFDLRWTVDQGESVMGRPSLARRWNWSCHAVRVLLDDPKTWFDPRYGGMMKGISRPRSGRRQFPANSPPIPRQLPNGGTSNISHISPVDRQSIANPSPAPNRSTLTPTLTLNNVAETEWAQAHEAWLVASRSVGGRPRALKRSKGLGAKLARALKAHGLKDVLSVIHWWATSEHSRAKYLRANGYGLDTLLRPSNLETYVDLTQHVQVKPPRPGQWMEPENQPEEEDPWDSKALKKT